MLTRLAPTAAIYTPARIISCLAVHLCMVRRWLALRLPSIISEKYFSVPRTLSFPAGYWDVEDGSQLYVENMNGGNVNTAAVNTAYNWGLCASGGKLKNYPSPTTPFASGLVVRVGGVSMFYNTGLGANSV